MAVKIQGGSSTAGQANVTSTFDLQVATSQTLAAVGGSIAVAEIDAGTVAAGGRSVRSIDVSDDYRTRVGIDQPVFRDRFNSNNANATRYSIVTGTATAAFAGRKLTLNGGSSLTSGHTAQVTTRANFQFSQTYPVYAEIWAAIPNAPQSNTVLEWGFGYVTGTSVPTDGVFFRYAAGGEVRGVINVAGAEVQTDPFTDLGGQGYTLGVQHHWLIIVDADQVEFWRDDVKLATIVRPNAEGGMSASQSLPMFARFYNAAAASTAQQLAITGWSAYTGDATNQKDPGHVAAINGHNACNAPDGNATASQSANYANTAAPASLTLANTTSTNGVLVLGGQWQFVAVAGAETDYIVFGYQNPAGASGFPGKNLLVYGVTIHSYNMGAASATTPTLLQWGLGFGGTVISLAGSDSLTTGAQAPRRITVGVQSFPVGTAVGGVPSNQIDFRAKSPYCVPPGGFLHLILKMPVGTATASQVIRGIAAFDAHIEVA